MKKLFLLLVGGSIVMSAGAQALHQAWKDINRPYLDKIEATGLHDYVNQRYIYANHGAEKATSGGSRWYFYGNAIDTSQEYQVVTVSGLTYQTMYVSEETIWNDTNGTVLYTGPTYQHVTDVCEGSVFDPKAAIFNTDPDLAYKGQIRVTGTDNYVWDSVSISGKYLFNSTKTGIVDTLRLSFITGSGGPQSSDDIFSGWSMAGGHYNSDAFLDITWDSLTNTASTHTYTTPYKYDILLTSGSWFDTSSTGFWDTTIATNGASGISVLANSLCGMSITFISGDPATHTGGVLHTPVPGDTLVSTWRGTGNNRYNVLRPLLAYYQTSGGTPAWPPFTCPSYLPYPKDYNLGYWKRLPNLPGNWDDIFTPTWGWSSSGGTAPADLQYADVGYHIVCATCALITPAVLGANNTITAVNNISAYPNPATGELNISFDLSQASDVAVTLTNMVGQVVAAQQVSNVAAGKVVFNTSALPAGVYIYTMKSDGGVTTGRVSVAH